MQISKPNDFVRAKQTTERDLIQPASPLPVLVINPAVLIPASNLIDWSLGNIHYQDISANKTYTFGTITEGQSILVRLFNTSASALTLTWPPGTRGAETTMPASMYKLFSFSRINGVTFATQVEIP